MAVFVETGNAGGRHICHDLQGKSHLNLENIFIENYKDKFYRQNTKTSGVSYSCLNNNFK